MHQRAIMIVAAVAFLATTLLGCHGYSVAGLSGPDVTVHGRVELSPVAPARAVQSTFADVANASTVSLMQVTGTNSVTVATTYTAPGGAFSLSFNNFHPDPTQTYILEAVKGLYGNQVDKSAARVRTLMQWTSGGWLTLTNKIPNTGIVIGAGSTAVSAMFGLYPAQFNLASTSELMGSVVVGQAESTPLPASADTFTPPAEWTNGKVDFHNVSDLVIRAITGDTDPLTGVQYDYVNKVFFVQTNLDPFITSMSSTAAGYGAPLTIYGYRFDTNLANDTVYFGGTTGLVAAIDSTKPNTTNVLYVTVPSGCASGSVIVRNASGTSNPVNFTVIPRASGTF